MDLIKEINKIKQEFNFLTNYDLHCALLIDLNNAFLLYQTRIKDIKSRKVIKKKLKDVIKYLYKAKILLDDKMLQQFKYMHDTSSNLNHIISELTKAISKPDKGGRLVGDSIKSFLVYHLLNIYQEGTGKPIKCGWDDVDDTGKGVTLSFLCSVRHILPLINKKFILGSDQSLCAQINKIRVELKEINNALESTQ